MLKLLLILWPLFEIAGFILVGNLIGVFPTLLLIIASTGLGMILLRRQGLKSLQQRSHGKAPVQDILGGPIVVLAGLLLLLPGFFSDILGLMILIPGVRQAMVAWLIKKGKIPQNPAAQNPEPQQPSSRVIEGEFWREDKKDDE